MSESVPPPGPGDASLPREVEISADSIVETIHEPLLVLSPDLRVKSANPAFFQHFAVVPEETLGRRIYELGNGQWDIPALRTLLEDVLPDSNVFNDFEVRHDFEDIGPRVMLVNARRLDHVQLILLGIRDISEQWRAREVLRASEAQNRLIVSSALDYAILTTDPEGIIESWSAGAEAVYGWSESEAIGQPIDMTFIPEDRAAKVPKWERDLALQDGSAPDVRWHVRKDGQRVFIDGVSRALDDADGVLRGFLKIGQDVTERRHTMDALRASEERFRTLVHNIRDYAIFMMNTDGIITHWNEGAERVKGYTAEEAVGRHASMFYPPEQADQLEQEMTETARSGRAEREAWRVCKDGRWIWVNEIATALRDSEGRLLGFAKISRDLTERRRSEDALRELNESLERRVRERTAQLEAEVQERQRSEQARREVLQHLVSAEEEERRRIAYELHDQIGQQMTGLLLGLHAARREAETPELDGRLSVLEKLARDTSRDIQNIAVGLRPPALDTLGLVAAVQNHVEDWSSRYDIEQDFRTRGLTGVRLQGEIETTLYRVVQESLTNVLKHARATRVSVILERKDGMLRAIVGDNGVGFDVDETLARPEKSRRLGIRGMSERVAHLGGEMEIESSPGDGTTVYVRIPASEALSQGLEQDGGR